MKRIYLSFITLIAFSLCSYAQPEIELIDVPQEYLTSPNGGVVSVEVDVKNNTSNPLDIWVRRDIMSTFPEAQNYFCWEACYTPQVFESPTSLRVYPGDTNTFFIAYFNPGGGEGTTTEEYCFYTEGDPELESCFTMDWVSSSSSSLADVEDPNRLSNAMPNPARDQVAIEYESDLGNARIVIYNLVGSVVKQVNLQNQEGRINMDVSDLSAGVYVYSLEAGNRTITSKKLSIVR